MLRIAVCDDEPYMLDELSALISGCLDGAGRSDSRLDRFSGGRALLDSGERFDLVFLDVQMDAPDGLETVAALRERGDEALLVFMTVLRERVFDAFEVRAFDYLLKPPDPVRLRRTLERALEALDRRRAGNLLIRRGTAQEVIPLAEIAWCEVLGRKVYLHRTDGTVLDYYDRLEALERRLGSGFFRCHRSYLVNLDHVRGLNGGRVTLDGRGGTVPVSRLRERDLTAALLRRMGERGD